MCDAKKKGHRRLTPSRSVGCCEFSGKGWCREGDLNSYRVAPTWPSTMRVCQFRHPGTGLFGGVSIDDDGGSVKPPVAAAPLPSGRKWGYHWGRLFLLPLLTNGGPMAVFVCGKCGHETAQMRCKPKSCPKCGAPGGELKKK